MATDYSTLNNIFAGKAELFFLERGEDLSGQNKEFTVATAGANATVTTIPVDEDDTNFPGDSATKKVAIIKNKTTGEIFTAELHTGAVTPYAFENCTRGVSADKLLAYGLRHEIAQTFAQAMTAGEKFLVMGWYYNPIEKYHPVNANGDVEFISEREQKDITTNTSGIVTSFMCASKASFKANFPFGSLPEEQLSNFFQNNIIVKDAATTPLWTETADPSQNRRILTVEALIIPVEKTSNFITGTKKQSLDGCIYIPSLALNPKMEFKYTDEQQDMPIEGVALFDGRWNTSWIRNPLFGLYSY